MCWRPCGCLHEDLQACTNADPRSGPIAAPPIASKVVGEDWVWRCAYLAEAVQADAPVAAALATKRTASPSCRASHGLSGEAATRTGEVPDPAGSGGGADAGRRRRATEEESRRGEEVALDPAAAAAGADAGRRRRAGR